MAALHAAGLTARWIPLFEARAVEWTPPDPDMVDALLLTSAQAVRLAGPGLDDLRHKPVVAVGPATAATARAAGLSVVLTGTRDAAAVVAEAKAAGLTRLLHLAGRDRVETGAMVRTVYAADPCAIPRDHRLPGGQKPSCSTPPAPHSAWPCCSTKRGSRGAW
ncbi:uroporphyrinogen-III synthase [Sphingomonas sp. I4]